MLHVIGRESAPFYISPSESIKLGRQTRELRRFLRNTTSYVSGRRSEVVVLPVRLADTDKGEDKDADQKGNIGGDADRAQELGKGDSPALIYPPGSNDIPTFVEDSSGEVSENLRVGGFSSITVVRISQGNGIKGLKPNAKFALKKYFNKSDTIFNEVEPLRLLASTRNPHIVELRAAFTQNGSHFLLMDLAQGNLRDFWNQNPDPTAVGDGLLIWVIEQCAGLTGALATVHNPADSRKAYRHGDIKPENILWYQKEQADAGDPKKHLGVLQISDFGAAETVTDTKPKSKTDTIILSITYRPPEVDLLDETMSCASDVWSLGCLFLEFVTWYLLGWEATEEFSHTRLVKYPDVGFLEDTFFLLQQSENHKIAIVNPAVKKWIDKLHNLPNCSRIIHEFLGLVEFNMLKVLPKDRSKAHDIAMKLKGLLNECRADVAACNEDILHTPSGGYDRPGRFWLSTATNDTALGWLDQSRIKIEGWLGEGEIDWSPLPSIKRPQSEGQFKLNWIYGGQVMSILLTPDEAQRCQGITRVPYSQPILPTAQNSGSGNGTIGSTPQGSSGLVALQSWLSGWSQRFRASRQGGGNPKAPSGSTPMVPTTKTDALEAFLCVEKVWSPFRDTRLCTVSTDNLEDDREFYIRARKALHDTQGPWLMRLFRSWKQFSKANLVEFSFLFSAQEMVDIVEYEESRHTSSNVCAGYTFDQEVKNMPISTHMRHIAKMISYGIRNPNLGEMENRVIKGIPKRKANPVLERKYGVSGWGFYIGQSLHLGSIGRGGCAVIVLGLVPVPFWLAFVDSHGIQDAFVPAGYLLSVFTVYIGMVALGLGTST
ncbi:kinase-like protein [Xylariaceae sp. AK1471]|nr:kinase-like protein [Xylariaceae sp. AK1471]